MMKKMNVYEDGKMIVVRYDWKMLREKKMAIHKERIEFMKGVS
jgi:hypothetical protein